MKKRIKITAKNAPSKLYMVVINMGGLVHDEIYELRWYFNEDQVVGMYDKTENIGFHFNSDGEYFGLNKSSYRCWEFITDKKDEAQTFLLGAKTTVDFMKSLWFK